MQNLNDPKPIQTLMGESTLSAIVRKAQFLDKINHALPDIIGEEQAAYCQVMNVKEGHLILSCTNSAIATHLRYQEEDFLMKLDRLIPDLPKISRLECVVRPK